jgi:hypothetical protein
MIPDLWLYISVVSDLSRRYGRAGACRRSPVRCILTLAIATIIAESSTSIFDRSARLFNRRALLAQHSPD